LLPVQFYYIIVYIRKVESFVQIADRCAHCLRSSLYNLRAAPTENTASSTVACWFTAVEMCLPHRCISTSTAWTIETPLFFCYARSLQREYVYRSVA
jgi:hypothetical protein